MTKIVKIIFEDGSEIEYIERPLEDFSKYSMPHYMFGRQHRNWLEDIVLPRFPDLESWAKDKYGLIDADREKSLEDFSNWEIERELRDRCITPNLIRNESITNQDFVSRLVEITDRGDDSEIDKALYILEKAYRIK